MRVEGDHEQRHGDVENARASRSIPPSAARFSLEFKRRTLKECE